MYCHPTNIQQYGKSQLLSVLLLLTLWHSSAVSAQNIVPNPSFEQINSCPNGIIAGMGNHCVAWGPVGGTPDYYHSCSVSGQTSVPNNFFGHQQPRTGLAYTGMYSGPGAYEYAHVQLSQPLIAGHQYYARMYVSLANNSPSAQNRMGMYFSAVQLFPFGAPVNSHAQIPQVVSPATPFLTDTSGWTLIQGTFTASGGEQWLSIGNFTGIAANFIPANSNSTIPGTNSYYYVDDICVFDLSGSTPRTIRKDTLICGDAFPAIVQAPAGEMYEWSTGATTSSISVSGYGTFWVRYIGDCSVRIDTIVVGEKIPDTITSATNMQQCLDDVILLRTGTIPADAIWQDGRTDSVYQATQPGIYWATYTQPGCLIHTDTFIVTNHNADTTSYTKNKILCAGTTLNITLPAEASHIYWYDGDNTATRSISDSGIYWVCYRMPGCVMVNDTICVVMGDDHFSLGPDTVICDAGLLILHAPDLPGAAYRWQDGSTGPLFRADQSGYYTVTVTNENGCANADTIHIAFISLAQQINDVILCREYLMNVPLQIHVPDAALLTWDDDSHDAVRIVNHPGRYGFTLSQKTCTYTDTILVESKLCSCNHTIPTAFSPNGDAKNDVFRPVFEPGCTVRGFRIRIYNRWGQEVYTSENQKGWDGNFNGQPAEVGTYFYEVRFEAGMDRQVYRVKGDLTLIR